MKAKRKIKIILGIVIFSLLLINKKNINITSIKDETFTNAAKVETKINNDNDTINYNGKNYKIIEVDGGDMSGTRQPNVAVDVGYGKERTYWAFTNENGQLINVVANEIILQDDNKEPVNENGRYYDEEANVPGTERKDLDQGHVIADSLGGVSNAYNITPQNSSLNRHGKQADMENEIRDKGGCKDFVATITYSNTTTQIPDEYEYKYIVNGKTIVNKFKNIKAK